jgi:L-lactate dehydrogenase complex protein LldF
MLAPQILGTEIAGALPFASSLCGACNEICPVKIPITDILLHLRHRVVEGDAASAPVAPTAVRVATRAGAVAMRRPWLYRSGSRALAALQTPWRRDGWLPRLPPPLNRWTMVRPMPAMAPEFRRWWRRRTANGRGGAGDDRP